MPLAQQTRASTSGNCLSGTYMGCLLKLVHTRNSPQFSTEVLHFRVTPRPLSDQTSDGGPPASTAIKSNGDLGFVGTAQWVFQNLSSFQPLQLFFIPQPEISIHADCEDSHESGCQHHRQRANGCQLTLTYIKHKEMFNTPRASPMNIQLFQPDVDRRERRRNVYVYTQI